eukprot:m.53829 g.53829  ORF g.53829 m.53829 type:complete len:628 (-) comp6802_c0_seq1:82-1965(-)
MQRYVRTRSFGKRGRIRLPGLRPDYAYQRRVHAPADRLCVAGEHPLHQEGRAHPTGALVVSSPSPYDNKLTRLTPPPPRSPFVPSLASAPAVTCADILLVEHARTALRAEGIPLPVLPATRAEYSNALWATAAGMAPMSLRLLLPLLDRLDDRQRAPAIHPYQAMICISQPCVARQSSARKSHEVLTAFISQEGLWGQVLVALLGETIYATYVCSTKSTRDFIFSAFTQETLPAEFATPAITAVRLFLIEALSSAAEATSVVARIERDGQEWNDSIKQAALACDRIRRALYDRLAVEPMPANFWDCLFQVTASLGQDVQSALGIQLRRKVCMSMPSKRRDRRSTTHGAACLSNPLPSPLALTRAQLTAFLLKHATQNSYRIPPHLDPIADTGHGYSSLKTLFQDVQATSRACSASWLCALPPRVHEAQVAAAPRADTRAISFCSKCYTPVIAIEKCDDADPLVLDTEREWCHLPCPDSSPVRFDLAGCVYKSPTLGITLCCHCGAVKKLSDLTYSPRKMLYYCGKMECKIAGAFAPVKLVCDRKCAGTHSNAPKGRRGSRAFYVVGTWDGVVPSVDENAVCVKFFCQQHAAVLRNDSLRIISFGAFSAVAEIEMSKASSSSLGVTLG